MSTRFPLFLAVPVLLAATAMAAETPANGPAPDALHQMRMKQQDEERGSVVRVIQPGMVPQESVCSPTQMTRQRLNRLGNNNKDKSGTVNVEAGHGDVQIDGNTGQVNNSVNVQIVNPNEKNCL
ncbi:MAG: hypothetical protein Q7S98_00790 [Deltaproteobacteria bacterium]|nr:hypothetical protein [Deltaproteobacteria bacterium]